MRKIIAIPGLSTIRKWLNRIEISEGFSTTIFQMLKLKSSVLQDDEKLVTLFLDEMAISERVLYFPHAKPDYFSGFPTKLPGELLTKVSVSFFFTYYRSISYKSLCVGKSQVMFDLND